MLYFVDVFYNIKCLFILVNKCRDGTRIHTWRGPKLKTEKKFMKIKTNIYFIFNKRLHTK